MHCWFLTALTGFNSEEEMLKMYALYQTQDPTNDVIAVVFHDNNVNISNKHLGYTIRTSYVIPNMLYKVETEQVMITLDQAFIEVIPFAQLQLCLDESFINMKAPNAAFKPQVCLCSHLSCVCLVDSIVWM